MGNPSWGRGYRAGRADGIAIGATASVGAALLTFAAVKIAEKLKKPKQKQLPPPKNE